MIIKRDIIKKVTVNICCYNVVGGRRVQTNVQDWYLKIIANNVSFIINVPELVLRENHKHSNNITQYYGGIKLGVPSSEINGVRIMGT